MKNGNSGGRAAARWLWKTAAAKCLLPAVVFSLAIAGNANAQSSGCNIKDTQQNLRGLGYNPGPIDGLWGKSTRRAIIEFQRNLGLDETGSLDLATCEAITRVVGQTATDERGKELFAAAETGDTQALDLLLARQTDVDWLNADGASSLMAASGRGFDEIVDKLLKVGASVDIQAKNGETALIVAAQEGHLGIVENLLENGAAVELQKPDGTTAFLAASKSGYTEVAIALKEADAEKTIPEKTGTASVRDTATKSVFDELFVERCAQRILSGESPNITGLSPFGGLDDAWSLSQSNAFIRYNEDGNEMPGLQSCSVHVEGEDFKPFLMFIDGWLKDNPKFEFSAQSRLSNTETSTLFEYKIGDENKYMVDVRIDTMGNKKGSTFFTHLTESGEN